MRKCNYIDVPSDSASQGGAKMRTELLELISSGYEILSAVAVTGGVHYVLREPLNLTEVE